MNEQNRTRGIASQNRLAAVKRGGGRGDYLKEGEGTSQGACMKDPWTWTMAWGLTIELGVGWAEGWKGEIIGTTVKPKNKK